MPDYTIVAEYYEGPLDEQRLLLHIVAPTPDAAIEAAKDTARLNRAVADPSEEPTEDEDPIKVWALFEGHHQDLSD